MAGTTGRRVRVKIATASAGPYVNILGIKSANHSLDSASIDDSEFGVEWVQKILGLKDGKLSLSGNRRLTDTTGQGALLSSLLDGTTVFVQFLPDGGTTASVGYQQEMIVSKFSVDGAVEGGVGLSVELEGNGPITLV